MRRRTPTRAAAPPPPRFWTLDREDCAALLARNSVGRLAYTHRQRVEIEPIHYVHDGEWLYGRTSLGTKLRALLRKPWVALEVDEVDGPFDWQSVVVRGGFYALSAHGPKHVRVSHERGVALLRTLVPETFTDADPAPFRTIVFRIHVDEMTGRAASTPRAREK